MDGSFALLSIVVFAAFSAQSIAGFGGTALAVALGAHLYTLDALLPVVVPLTVLSAGWIAVRHREHVDRDLLLRRILPTMGAGVAIGLLVFHLVDVAVLKRAYGALICALAARDLVGSLRRDAPAPPGRAGPWLLAAGVVHGIYATGGPLVVHAVGRERLSARASRSTLAALWVVLNVATTVAYVASGRLAGPSLPRIAALLPVVALAVAAGERAHARVDERTFRRITAALLLVAGASLVV